MSNGQVFAPSQRNPVIEPGPRDFYAYPLLFASVAFGATANGTINIEADSNFYCTSLAYMVDIAGAVQTDSTRVIPLMTVLITDSGSGRQLTNGALPINTIFGEADNPARFVHPRLFQRTTSIGVQVTNYSAATTYTNLYLVFTGFKVYGVGRR